jgi:hypothetical protein
VILIFSTENLELFFLLILNYVFIMKLKADKLSLYKRFQKYSIVCSFLYLVGVYLVCLANNILYLNIINITFCLRGVLLLPLMVTLLSNMSVFKFLNSFVLDSKLINLFKMIHAILIFLTLLFMFFLKDHNLSKYYLSVILFLYFPYILINDSVKK